MDFQFWRRTGPLVVSDSRQWTGITLAYRDEKAAAAHRIVFVIRLDPFCQELVIEYRCSILAQIADDIVR